MLLWRAGWLTAHNAVQGVTMLQSEHVMGGRHGNSLGRVEEIAASHVDDLVALVNHQYTLMVVNVTDPGRGSIVCTLQSQFHPGISDLAWSPDGRWLAFTFTVSEVRRQPPLLPHPHQHGPLLTVCC